LVETVTEFFFFADNDKNDGDHESNKQTEKDHIRIGFEVTAFLGDECFFEVVNLLLEGGDLGEYFLCFVLLLSDFVVKRLRCL
jgi:hypothetical protein